MPKKCTASTRPTTPSYTPLVGTVTTHKRLDAMTHDEGRMWLQGLRERLQRKMQRERDYLDRRAAQGTHTPIGVKLRMVEVKMKWLDKRVHEGRLLSKGQRLVMAVSSNLPSFMPLLMLIRLCFVLSSSFLNLTPMRHKGRIPLLMKPMSTINS